MKKKAIHGKLYRCIFVLGLLLVSIFPYLRASASEEGTLTIQKFQVERYKNLQQSTGQASDYKDVPENAQVIENVEFKLEKLLVDNAVDEVTPSTMIDTSFEARIQRTDANGETIFVNLPKGYYLVTENVPSGYNVHTERFVVQIPNTVTDASGNKTTNYDVVVYPKGQKIQVEKTRSSALEVVGVGDIITWDVLYPMGPDLKREETVNGVTTTSYGKNFYLTDEMDPRLDYVEGSVSFRYFDIYDNEIDLTLVEGIDYHLPYNKETHVLRINFTDNVGTNKVADANVAFIRMSLGTRVNASALNTVEVLWNNARIVFENTSGDPYEHEVFPAGAGPNDSRIPKVSLGQIAITKVDAQDVNKRLKGATFYLADSRENAKAGKFKTQTIDENGTQKEIVVTTDENGEANIYAIGAGVYYLVETTAPEGYTKITEPMEVVVANNGNRNITQTMITNTQIGSEPSQPPKNDTGGKSLADRVKTGDVASILGLLLLMVASVGIIVVYLWKRKKRKEIQ
jgi:Predicted outer membrane protein